MDAVTRIIKILGGIDGAGYSFGDLISDVIGGVVTIGGFLASAGVFAYIAIRMYIHTYLRMYVYTYVCMYVFMYVFTYILRPN